MNLRLFFLVLCLLGVVLPLYQFIPWVLTNGLNTSLFIEELFSTRIGAFFGLDVIVSALVLVVFIISEGKKLNIPRLWLPILATFSIGVSFGLPLFLYLRQLKIDQAPFE